MDMANPTEQLSSQGVSTAPPQVLVSRELSATSAALAQSSAASLRKSRSKASFFFRSKSLMSISDAVQDPDSAVYDTARNRFSGMGFKGYFALCFATCLCFAGASIGLWSEIGCGNSCFNFLLERQKYAMYCGAFVLIVVLTLYLLDYFRPPPEVAPFVVTRFLGCCATGLAGIALLAAGYFSANFFPALPLVLTTFLCPVAILMLRKATVPDLKFVRDTQASKADEDRSFKERVMMLNMLTGEEQDQRNFWAAAMYSFALTGVLCLALWIPWAATTTIRVEEDTDTTTDLSARDLLFIRWSAPLIVAVSNIVFTFFAGLRVAMDQCYNATDQVKNKLRVGRLSQELMSHRMRKLQEQLAVMDPSNRQEALKITMDKKQQYLVQHISHMRQLQSIVKVTGCAFIASIGSLYIAFQLTVADSHIALMVQSFISALFLTFLAFVMVSFDRLWVTMRSWLMDLPMWKAAIAFGQSDAARGALICIFGPVVPVVLVLSCANQCVRRCRGIGTNSGCLTARVQAAVDSARAWDWLRVLWWCYVIAVVLIVYKATPILLNVLLAWMSSVMADLHFSLIVMAYLAAGFTLFMLPPVPGPPIYIFGGIIISAKCPWGFWWGAAICILISFCLKLVACAVQQKLIGERLGRNFRVRQTVGVHKPFIRAIERVLQKPGLSFGKCMILCGGPDWPTSVLAGILRLSLRQCLLGTFPVIASVIPLALTGSFYYKRTENEIWLRAGNLMFALTALVSVGFWAGMGWAIQEEFEKNNHELTRAKEEFVELDWLDYRIERINQACTSVVRWGIVPFFVKAAYLGGAIIITLAGQFVFWRTKMCFGSFQVTDPIADLVWYGAEGLLRLPGAIALCLATFGWLGFKTYTTWRKRVVRDIVGTVSAELDTQETAWKFQRRQEAAQAITSKPATPPHEDCESQFVSTPCDLGMEEPRSASGIAEELESSQPICTGKIHLPVASLSSGPSADVEQHLDSEAKVTAASAVVLGPPACAPTLLTYDGPKILDPVSTVDNVAVESYHSSFSVNSERGRVQSQGCTKMVFCGTSLFGGCTKKPATTVSTSWPAPSAPEAEVEV